MHFWIVNLGEPLPTDPSARLLRHGILAQQLVDAGHQVTWWTSTRDHSTKKHRFLEDTCLEPQPGYRIHLLRSRGFKRNVSLARIIDHHGVAVKFAGRAAAEPPPDLVFVSLPTIDFSYEAVRYARAAGVPVVVDLEDLWPDVFLEAVPGPLRGLGRVAMAPMERRSAAALRGATGIFAVSESFLKWGLRHAGREAGPFDRVFPLGYQQHDVSPEDLAASGARLRQMGVQPEKTVAWFIGMFGRVYDVPTVLAVAREMHREGRTDLQFVISGDGDRRDEWRGLAEGLDNVVFTGWLNVPDIAYMMDVADIGLAAIRSVSGTLPNKFFEYLAAGVPLLSSLQGDAAALLERHDCGISYRQEDPAAFRTALLSLVDHPEKLRRQSENARRLYEERYSSTIIYPNMIDCLERIVSERTSSGPSREPVTASA